MQKKAEFEALALPHLDSLYRTALRMAGQGAAAEDLVQETYLKAYRSYHLFEPGTNFRAWIFRILRNAYINTYRERGRAPALTDFTEMEPRAAEDPVHLTAAEVEAFKENVGDEAKKAIEKMPPDYRMVFLLSALEDMSYKEIAAVMEIPVGTVMSRLFRAREILRQDLAGYAEAAGFRKGGEAP